MVQSLAELIRQLDIYFNSGNEKNKMQCLVPLINSYTGTDWKDTISYDHYNYKKNLIYRSKYYELYVICWLPNHKTPTHNHSENGCIFKILDGTMTEVRYNNKRKKTINIYQTGTTHYIDNDIGVHQVINAEKRLPLVSLHLYSPINYKFITYNHFL